VSVYPLSGVYPSGGATFKQIAEVTLSSAGTAIIFTGLDLKASKYLVILFKIKNATNSASNLYLYINNDITSTHYYSQSVVGSGSTASASQLNSSLIAGLPAGATVVGMIIISISPDNYPTAVCVSGYSGYAQVYGWKYTYATVSNVTQVDIRSVYNMDVGSHVIVFSL
jgi:hypothetical protein